MTRPVPRAALAPAAWHRALPRAAAGCAALVVLAACTPDVPDDQTTSVDVARYQDLAADPWLAATSLTVGRYAFGTNRQFEAGSGRSARTTTGTAAHVLAGETAAAADQGWVVAAARCDDAAADAVTVELVRELSDGSVAVGELRLEQDQSAAGPADGPAEGSADGSAVDRAAREVPRRVLVAAFAPHHTNDLTIDVPPEPVAYESLSCLGGSGGAGVGPDDLLAAVQGGDGGDR
ncbi:hypothetical protein ACT17Q_10470 [Cellulomonas sp. CW35]|uniref:hypothetical protein n=1 Tax=Cellulomonas sp. CW35 TaxID=3458249 RepID=UPI0040347BF8